ncbi:STAS domain-containing protein [Micromonospora sp. NPDC049230]|uniref:STAS domain-containing protein n=1 Tax=Micromonospora sp. NPDC049230 TaxID=3155502 RepID=UPI0033F79992
MSDQLLTIEATRLDAGHVRLRLTGELDYASAPELIAVAADLRDDQQVLIDLTGVSLCDSSGLSALLVVRRAAGAIRLIGAGPHLQRMLDRTGLTELLTMKHAADDLRAVEHATDDLRAVEHAADDLRAIG